MFSFIMCLSYLNCYRDYVVLDVCIGSLRWLFVIFLEQSLAT